MHHQDIDALPPFAHGNADGNDRQLQSGLHLDEFEVT